MMDSDTLIKLQLISDAAEYKGHNELSSAVFHDCVMVSLGFSELMGSGILPAVCSCCCSLVLY